MLRDIVDTIKYAVAKTIEFIVELIKGVTLLSTLVSIGACILLFFMCFFTGHPEYALLCLAGILCFIHANKQF